MDQKDLLRVEFMQVIDPFGRVNVQLETPRLRLECSKDEYRKPREGLFRYLKFDIFLKDEIREPIIGYVDLIEALRASEISYGLEKKYRHNFYASEALFAVVHGLLPQLKAHFNDRNFMFGSLLARVSEKNRNSQKVCNRILSDAGVVFAEFGNFFVYEYTQTVPDPTMPQCNAFISMEVFERASQVARIVPSLDC